ncbi:Peptidase-M1 domain-containing protein [Acanthopleuribacter pedis]
MLTIAKQEYRYMTHSSSFTVLFGVLLGLFFLLTANSGEFIGTARGGQVFINAPYMIMMTHIVLGVFSIFIVPSFMASTLLKDLDSGFDGILYALPIPKGAFLGGRFLGAFGALVTVLAAAPLGMMLGCLMPWVDESSLLPLRVSHYGTVFFVFLVPSVLVTASFIFSVAALTRSLIATYVTALAVLVLYLVVSETNLASPLWDPFMHRGLEEVTAYWTAAERNHRLLPFDRSLLANRLLWFGLAALGYGVALVSFSFRVKHRAPKAVDASDTAPNAHLFKRPTVRQAWDRRARQAQLLHRALFEIRETLVSPPFLLVLLLSAVLVAVSLLEREVLYGVNAYPLTRLMIAAVIGSNGWALLAILGFYSAEMIQRERAVGVDPLVDTLPVANGVLVTAKLIALLLMMVSVLALGVTLAVAYQLYSGTVVPEWTLYLERIFLLYVVRYLCLAILACFFHVIAPNRLVGMLLLGLFILVSVGMNDLLGSEHPLLKYGLGGFSAPYSDMNGSGRFRVAVMWLQGYWGGIAGLLLVATYALWPRGIEQPMRLRLRRLLHRRNAAPALGSLAVSALCGGFIFVNTNVLNEHLTTQEATARRVAFEKRTRPFLGQPIPRIIEVDTEVAIYPDRGRVESRGFYLLENKTEQAVSELHVHFSSRLEIAALSLEGGWERERDPVFNFVTLTMVPAMMPGEQRTLRFETVLQQRGFTSGRPDVHLVRNGTFLRDSRLMPYLGVNPDLYVQDAADRRDFGLEPLPGRPKLENPRNHDTGVNRGDSDFIQFRTRISTSDDQIALAPGELTERWTENGRNTFVYRMERPMMHFTAYLSADYQVVRDQWGDVAVEIYHHAPHTYNVARMSAAVKDSLALFSEIYSPYPHKHLRIVEFPAYRSFAQSFAGMIPYSEALGFVAQVEAGDIDIPYYVTAHEIAHQWWGHQVTPADCQGADFLNETLSQYSALLVMEQKYGRNMIHKFLGLELDRYLRGRAEDPEGELPLAWVESQDYIHYRKGSLVMYALRDYLGAERVNRVLRRLIALRGYQSRPYATSRDFLNLLREEAGPAYEGLIVDWFEKITLYDLEAKGVRVAAREDGRFDVTLDVRAAKLYADAVGNETRTDFDLPVDIGLFRRDPSDDRFSDKDVIFLEKRELAGEESTLHFTVDQEPRFVGIDPYHKLIDRVVDDNLIAVAE